MLEVSEELKELYKKRSMNKELLLLFKEWNKTIGNENLKMESMGIVESICSDTELTFGGCEAAEFSITVVDITEDLNGQTFTVTQILDNNPAYSMPLGTYTVKSCKRQSDRRFKDIVAYDDMIKLDRDVVAWYYSRTFPVTLKSLRESLLVYCGIAYESQDLPNDGVLINKTVRPSAMNGRDVMKRICELNGGFGHITRENKFKVITLAGLGLYPSETLYPSEDLFPAESGELIDGSSSGASYYPESTYEDYICRAIDQLKIRTNEEDGGVTVNNGTVGKNEYIIQGNFLISDKTKEELTDIAEALFLIIKNKYYRPHNMIVTGLPYLEVGDSILINTRDDVIESFIFTRTLTGIQSLKDSLGATGYEYRQNKVGLDTQISQLEQTASQLQDTTEEIEQDIEDIQEENGQTKVSLKKLEDGMTAEVSRATKAEGELSSKVQVTAEEIAAEVKRASTAEGELSSKVQVTAEEIAAEVKRASTAEGNLSVRISATATEVSSKVSKDELASEISQTAEAIRLEAGQLIFISNQFKLDENGNVYFAGIIEGGYLYIKDHNDEITKVALEANQDTLFIGGGFSNGIVINGGSEGLTVSGSGGIGCKKINGYLPINAGNLSEYMESRSCSYAVESYSSEYTEKATYSTSNEHTANCFITDAMNIYKVPSGSSKRFKEDISNEINEELNPHKLYELPVVQFKYKPSFYNFPEDTEMPTVIGIIAEDVAEIYPCAAEKDEDSGLINNWNVRYLVPPMLKLIQEQKSEIDSLRIELSELKALLTERGVI